MKELISKYKDGEYQKTAFVRILDVFLYAPVIIGVGIKAKNLNPFARVVLVGMGAGTLIYNGINLVKDIAKK